MVNYTLVNVLPPIEAGEFLLNKVKQFCVNNLNYMCNYVFQPCLIV